MVRMNVSGNSKYFVGWFSSGQSLAAQHELCGEGYRVHVLLTLNACNSLFKGHICIKMHATGQHFNPQVQHFHCLKLCASNTLVGVPHTLLTSIPVAHDTIHS
jgi:hypothetical protein